MANKNKISLKSTKLNHRQLCHAGRFWAGKVTVCTPPCCPSFLAKGAGKVALLLEAASVAVSIGGWVEDCGGLSKIASGAALVYAIKAAGPIQTYEACLAG